MTKFEEQFIDLLQKEIDDKKVVPLDFDLIYRMKAIQEKANEAELRSIMKDIAAKFGYEVDHFEDNEFMCSKWVSAKIDIGDERGDILADMNWELAGVLSEEEYDHLYKWDKHGSFDALEVLGMRYKEIIFDEGVSEEDINFVKKFHLTEEPNIVSVTLDAPIELVWEEGDSLQ